MIKTCKLQTCDDLYEIELKDVLYSPDNTKIMKVTGEVLLELPIEIDKLTTKLDRIESMIDDINGEGVYSQIEKELNEIRDLVNQIENEYITIENDINDFKNKINELINSDITKEKIDDLRNDLEVWKENIETEIELLKNQVNSNTNEIKNLQDKISNNSNEDIDDLKNKTEILNDKINNFNNILDNKKEINSGGLTFKNKNGKTLIKFNSEINYNSDYGYIEYKDDDDNYAFWCVDNNSKENSALIIGVENDGQNNNSDVVVLKSKAGVIVDSPSFFINKNEKFVTIDDIINDISGMPKYNFDSGWVTITQDGLEIDNPLGENAFFIGFAKIENDIIQFGVFSTYVDDDNADTNDSGVYLLFNKEKIIISVRKKNNDNAPSAIGLSDGVSYQTKMLNTFQARIIGWKLKG